MTYIEAISAIEMTEQKKPMKVAMYMYTMPPFPPFTRARVDVLFMRSRISVHVQS